MAAPKYKGLILNSTVSVNEIISSLEVQSNGDYSSNEAHDFPEICYVKSGTNFLLLNGHRYRMTAGQMVIYAPLSYHGGYDRSDSKLLIVSMKLEDKKIHGLYDRILTLNEELQAECEKFFALMFETFHLKETVNDTFKIYTGENASPLELEILKKEFETFILRLEKKYLTDNSKKSSKHSAECVQIINYLNDHLCETLTVEQIAKDNRIGTSKLKQMFRELHGCGVLQYHINMKLEEAKRLLRVGEMNITQISEYLGFSTVHYFSRLFKNKIGVSPNNYQKSFYNGTYYTLGNSKVD